MEHSDAAQVAALLGAVGAVLALLPRGRVLPLLGFLLLGLATADLGRSLVGDDDLELLFTEPKGLVLVGVGAVAAVLGAIPLVRYPAIVPVALLAVAPFRIPIELGEEEAFLLLPLYLVLTASVLALGYRVLRGEDAAPGLPLVLALPIAAFVAFTSLSYLWTWDEREGAIALAFFVFPFTAALGVVVRAPRAPWLPRALLATLVGLGVVFASIGIWQAQTRTLFFARDVEVANAYTSFFRVTSLFKDPSLYGRYLVVPIAVLLVVILFRRGRTIDWVAAAALCAFLFWGLFYSYSQSSFVALFVVTFAVALVALGKRMRIALAVAALAATLAAAALAADAVNGRSAKDVTSGRSRLVSITLDAFQARPLTGVGVGGQPKASAQESGRRTPNRSASHTTPLTVLAELGIVGFALYGWLLAATGWGLLAVFRRDRVLGAALAAVFVVLVVHSTLYAGFFEDPLTWGVFGLTGAALAAFGWTAVADDASRVSTTLGRAGLPGLTLMRRRIRWILAALSVLLVSVAGLAVALWLSHDRPSGALDTELTDVTTSTATTTKPEKEPPPKPRSDKLCWLSFGGDPQRSLARPGARLGLPARQILWTRGLKDYIEYPPSYCQGRLYVNTYAGDTYAIDAETGRVLWKRRGNNKPSTPAIDGPRLIVSSKDGSVSALSRRSGKVLWRVQTAGKVESSPVVIDGLAYFGSTDGRLFAVRSATGRIKWAYDTRGRINASPSVFGNRVCISTYAGSVVCVRKNTGREIWTTYVRRDTFRDESFYASPSTDGERIYTVSRSGTVVALNAQDGDVVWTGRVGGLGYTTPAVADGRIYVGGFDGKLRALRARDGNELWQTDVPGRILGAPVVIGDFVFFSTLEKRTYALRLSDGKIVWRLPMGRYSPGIATERTYYFSLNGRLIAVRGRNTL